MLSALVFSTLLWLSLILALRFCLKLLLSYHQWMFEQHGRVSNVTKVWVVRFFSVVVLTVVVNLKCYNPGKICSVVLSSVSLRLCWGYYRAGSLCCTVIRPLYLTCLYLPSKTHWAGWVDTHIIYTCSIICVNTVISGAGFDRCPVFCLYLSTWSQCAPCWRIQSFNEWLNWPITLRLTWETGCNVTLNSKLCGPPTM